MSPVPSFAPAKSTDEQLVDTLRDEIYAALGGSRYLSDDIAISNACKARNIGLLTAFAKNVPQSKHRLAQVNSVYGMLDRAGYDKPESYLSPEAVALHDRLRMAFLEIDDEKRIHVESPMAPTEMMCFVLTSSVEDQPLIERIVMERRIAKVDEVRELLKEMKEGATALLEGNL
jgi:hypothetical protein